MHQLSTPETLSAVLRAATEPDPGRPLITYYDQASGERTELSGTTFGNWVAKTVGFLRDDLDLQPGGTLALALPAHWHTMVLCHAAWHLGATVAEWRQVEDPDVLVCGEPRLMELADAEAGEIVVTSLDPMGRGVAVRPPHVIDYLGEVRAHPDHLSASTATPQSPAFATGGSTMDQRHAVAAATELAARLGFEAGDRVLFDTELAESVGLLTWAVAPLTVGGSVVLAHPAADSSSAAWLERIAEQERITRTPDDRQS